MDPQTFGLVAILLAGAGGGLIACAVPAARAAPHVDPLTPYEVSDLESLLRVLRPFRIGFHAVRVNDQFRIVFRFEGADAFDVRCTDYH